MLTFFTCNLKKRCGSKPQLYLIAFTSFLKSTFMYILVKNLFV